MEAGEASITTSLVCMCPNNYKDWAKRLLWTTVCSSNTSAGVANTGTSMQIMQDSKVLHQGVCITRPVNMVEMHPLGAHAGCC